MEDDEIEEEEEDDEEEEKECSLDSPVKLIVLLRPYFESNAEATAFFTSAEISAAHLSPIETFVPKTYYYIVQWLVVM